MKLVNTGVTVLHRARSCMKAAQLKARATAFTSAGKHEPVIFSFPTNDPCRYTSVQHMMVMHRVHNEGKQETIVKILLEN